MDVEQQGLLNPSEISVIVLAVWSGQNSLLFSAEERCLTEVMGRAKLAWHVVWRQGDSRAMSRAFWDKRAERRA